MNKTDELVFLPLGGTGEIGMNLNLYGFGPENARKWIMVDLGVTFADSSTPGIDVIMPDPVFIEERREDLLGIVLTHGHEDHIGAVAHLWPQLRCDVYATPFTAELVKAKLIEAGLEDEVPLKIIQLGGRFELGPFDIELVTLTHSIPEPNALAIRTPLGLVMHTGDWKIDPDPVLGDDIDIERLTEIGNEGVRAIVCDSTNVFTPGVSGSEADVGKGLTEIIGELKGKVAVTTFASNVARLESVIRAAEACERHVVLVGRSMHRVIGAARETGYLKNIPPFVPEDEAGYLPADNVLYLCTGSQGEPRAALSRIASDSHQHVTLGKGDTVIFSSRMIPGNDVEIFALQNTLAERGVRVITEKDHFVHVSGHPCRDELARMYQLIKPEVSVPVHGEARHLLEHAELARELQVPQAVVLRNGLMLRLAPGAAEVIDEAPSGRLFLDGDVLIPEGDPAVQERRRLAFAGTVFVTLVLDGKGEVLGEPQVRLLGLPEDDGTGVSFEERALDAVDDVLDRLPLRKRKDDGAVAELVRRAVRGAIRREWGKKAAVEVVVTRV
ncbi:ribonuclease J [Tepidicaulis sp. LMO-SS28]|uniref:ribonuclease J n=1 Tax=Tepidicaulis sp. LMO-SS28 TaxID=3447455 RepID=UPI003EE13AFE